MCARLLICVGWLALSCLVLAGCGEEDPESSVEIGPEDVVVREGAKLVKTVPANGEDASEFQPVVLHFDKEPRSVTVNGTAARVEGKRAVWCFPNPTEFGDQLFHIKWTNPDGSPNIGAFIRLTVHTPQFSEPSITLASVLDGDADVDPEPLYLDGIRFEFDESVIDLKSKLLTEDGEDLGWEVVSDERTLIFRLGANGELLENGRRYTIQIVVAEPWIYGEFACECMDCSWYKDTEITIGFVTIDK